MPVAEFGGQLRQLDGEVGVGEDSLPLTRCGELEEFRHRGPLSPPETASAMRAPGGKTRNE